MMPIKITIYIQPSDLMQFSHRHRPERPQDVTVTLRWRPDSTWSVEMPVELDEFTFREIDPLGAKIIFRRDLTDEEHRVRVEKFRAEYEKETGEKLIYGGDRS
jgi:hypothetical protein